MKDLTTLYENLIIRAITAPVYYKDRGDLLLPYKNIYKGNDALKMRDLINKDSENPKGHKYFMVDAKQTLSLLVSEMSGGKYSVMMSTTGSANDFFSSFSDFETVIDFVESIGIDAEKLKESKL